MACDRAGRGAGPLVASSGDGDELHGSHITDLNISLKQDAGFDAWLTRRTPAGRWGEVDELVGTLLYLASPASDFVNGQTIYVDGGLLAVL